VFLDALLKLRQVCCDPRLVKTAAAAKVKTSAKLEQLMDMLPEMLAEGRRVLLFSQFTSMLSLIEDELKARNIPWAKLTGQTQKRDEVIDRFTSGQVPLFLISLKAGGVGLNLPQADTVIHFDPWWNPAAENQATDRAHRIGQTQSVWVIKLVAQGTIEERILALQERKAELARELYSGATGRKQPLFTEDDVRELLQPMAGPLRARRWWGRGWLGCSQGGRAPPSIILGCSVLCRAVHVRCGAGSCQVLCDGSLVLYRYFNDRQIHQGRRRRLQRPCR
jgi:SNF2 family DNA or RNA helicase